MVYPRAAGVPTASITRRGVRHAGSRGKRGWRIRHGPQRATTRKTPSARLRWLSDSFLLEPAQWFAVLRIALGAWWLKSFWHKDKRAWLQRSAGIKWATSVAEKHK